MSKRVFVTSDDNLVKLMFRAAGWTVVNSISDEFDLMCFTGGADISPYLYGERPLPGTEFSTRRDNLEIKYWKSREMFFPKVGICRGAQLGNVLSGGSLWQDVDGHQTSHFARDYFFGDNALIPVSSVHHQMCRLTEDALLIASAAKATRLEADGEHKRYGVQTGLNHQEDIEAFYYTHTNFLGVQFHPEYSGYKHCTEYFWRLVDGVYTFDRKDKQPSKHTTDKSVPLMC